MKSTFRWSLILTSLSLVGAIATAQSEPPPPQNPQAPNVRPQRPERPRMSPEERRKQSEEKLRSMMKNNGITDATTQDAVLDFLANELTARRPLRQLGLKLQHALSDQSVSDAQIQAIIADYQNAQDLEHQRRTKAQKDLDNKIRYSQNPRLQGLLLLMGVLGDGPPLQAPRDNSNRPNQNVQHPGASPEMRDEMMKKFDTNKDGKLDANERAAIRNYRQERSNKQNDKNAAASDNN